jgi:hypothetical protein
MIFLIRRWPWYIRWLTNEYTATYIHWLRGLCSSVENVFIGFGIEKYSTVIFLDTEEYLSIEQNTLFSCSEARLSSSAAGINPKTLARLGPLPPPCPAPGLRPPPPLWTRTQPHPWPRLGHRRLQTALITKKSIVGWAAPGCMFTRHCTTGRPVEFSFLNFSSSNYMFHFNVRTTKAHVSVYHLSF